jgi:GT2 family glycosyltransferase
MDLGGGWYKNVLNLDTEATYVINEKDVGYDASMNQGAKLAKYDYLLFMENDIFVHENWLTDLRYYLDHDLTDIITPLQMPMRREEYLGNLKKSYEESLHPGWQEQGMLMLKKSMFEKIGGWDERFKMVYSWKAFQTRLRRVGARVHNTDKVYITHLCAQTILDSEERKPDEYYDTKTMEGEIKL